MLEQESERLPPEGHPDVSFGPLGVFPLLGGFLLDCCAVWCRVGLGETPRFRLTGVEACATFGAAASGADRV